MTKAEATAAIREKLDEILVLLGEDFDALVEATDAALDAVYYESQEIVTQ